MPRLDRLPQLNRNNLLMLPVQVSDTAPFTRLATPLPACRLAIVTTAGQPGVQREGATRSGRRPALPVAAGGGAMNRRAFLSAVTGGLLAAPLAAEAQSTPTVRRIGVLGGEVPDHVEARREGLRRLGWVEGHNIVVERLRLGDGSSARLQELARDLVRLKIEVIMASNNVNIAAAKAATTTIPIVMVYGDDPVRQGYIASFARPGGNITGGTSSVTPDTLGEIRGKRLELLAEYRPGLSRLALLVDPNSPGHRTFVLSAEASARSRGIAVQAVEVREAGELAGAFARMVKDRAHAIEIVGSPFFYGSPAKSMGKQGGNQSCLGHRAVG